MRRPAAALILIISLFMALRDLITSKMTSDQIAEAKRLAREWNPKMEK